MSSIYDDIGEYDPKVASSSSKRTNEKEKDKEKEKEKERSKSSRHDEHRRSDDRRERDVCE